MNLSVRCRLIFAAVLIAAVSGCGTPAERARQRLIDCLKELADVLSAIKTAEESRQAAPKVEVLFQKVLDAMQEHQELHAEKTSNNSDAREMSEEEKKKALQKVMEEMAAHAKVWKERVRLMETRGLAPEFWDVFTPKVIEFELASSNSSFASHEGPNRRMLLREQKRMIEKHGCRRTVFLEIVNVPVYAEAEVFSWVKRAAPNSELVSYRRGQSDEHVSAVLAPVNDYDAFLKSLNFAFVSFEDKPRSFIMLAVNPDKLPKKRRTDSIDSNPGGGPKPDAPIGALPRLNPGIAKTPEQLEEEKRRREEAQAEMLRRMEEERKKREPNPDSPDYFDKLAEMMTSSNLIDKSKAIDLLIAADTAKASAEVRGKIARNFKQMAEGGSAHDKSKAIRGLVVWGGQFSVPILIKMLESGESFVTNDLIRALGELKDPRAVEPVAARLKDIRYRDAAAAALRSIGPAAEDALIEIAPTTDPQLCLLAVNLLGDVGTPKSFEVLRMGMRSRNPAVQEASKRAMAKINGRKAAAKPAN